MPFKHAQARVIAFAALFILFLWSADRVSSKAAADAAPAAPNSGPALTVADELSVAAGEILTVPIRFQRGEQDVAGIGLSLDFDQACLAFDESDEDENGLPDAVSFDVSPQFFPSVTYSNEDVDGEIDIILADYSPPLTALESSDQLISVRFTAICQPLNDEGELTLIGFSSDPAVSYSSPGGQAVVGSATGASVLIRPQPDFTPQPTPTATPTATPIPSPTSTPVPVPGNRAPTVGNDTAVTNEDTSVVIDVLDNDSDPDGDDLTVDLTVPPAHGHALVNPDRTVTYVPYPNFNGNDWFTYTVSDGRGGALAAVVNIVIRAVNDPPVILIAPSDQTNQTGDTVILAVSVNDVDTAQETLDFTAEGLPSGIEVDSEQFLISGTIGDDAVGIHAVVLTVSDGALQDRVQFQWTVTGSVETYPIYLPYVRK